MAPGATMYSIAEELNISVATVSRAFADSPSVKKEKKELILKTAERLGYTPNNMASRLSQSPIYIGVLIYGYMSVYDNEIVAGIEAAYHEMNGFKVVCDIKRLYAPESTLKEAIAVIDDFKEKKYRAVMISKLPGDVERKKIAELQKAGIETVIFDADISNSKRLFVSMNNIDVATNMVAQLFQMIIPKKEKKVILFNSCDQEDLTASFHKHAIENNIEVVATEKMDLRTGNNGTKVNMEIIDNVLKRNPDVNGIYVSHANCIPICKYIEAHHLEKKIRFITSDIFDEMKKYFLNDVIDASIYQDPYSQGFEAFKNLYYYLAEKRKTSEQLLVHPQIIMKTNLKLFNP